jgi:hypothetical protein
MSWAQGFESGTHDRPSSCEMISDVGVERLSLSKLTISVESGATANRAASHLKSRRVSGIKLERSGRVVPATYSLSRLWQRRVFDPCGVRQVVVTMLAAEPTTP